MKAAARAKVKHPFHAVKRRFDYRTTDMTPVHVVQLLGSNISGY